MPKFTDQLQTVYAADRSQWRSWLAAHHQAAIGVWLVYYKVSSSQPSVQYSEAVKEALCFGWIDSKVNSLDQGRYMQIFTPRKPKSVWSKLNRHVAELLEQGLITPAGLAKIEAAKQDGSWTSLDAVEALIVPEDLATALQANAAASAYFAALSNSAKKHILYWIASAKRPETRSQRIERTIQATAQQQNPLVKSSGAQI